MRGAWVAALACGLLAFSPGLGLPGAPVAQGRFGGALAPGQKARAAGRDVYTNPPITVECWARLASKTGFNLLVANEPKESGTHWELYSYQGSGVFSAYLPGYAPGEVLSSVDITDSRWHYLAMQFDGASVKLYVDGRQVADRPVTRRPEMARRPGELVFGTADAVNQPLSCDGYIDEVRISRGILRIAGVPERPFASGEDTLGLWHMDIGPKGGLVRDASPLANNAVAVKVGVGSMDAIDRESFHAGPSPMASAAATVKLAPGAVALPAGAPVASLDGNWQMAEGGSEADRLTDTPWHDAVLARVPGSVHSALQAAGRIPDPKFGRNDAIAHAQSFKTWWLRRSFRWDSPAGSARLTFGGVAIRCTVWLNGRPLGRHDGMFGGPTFEVGPWLRRDNALVVRLDPAPGDPKAWSNPAWRETVVFNCTWGWHYSSIPPLGIWRPVRVEAAPAVRLDHPFVDTREARSGLVDLSVRLVGRVSRWSGRLQGTVTPETFAGKVYHFAVPVRSSAPVRTVHLRFRIPDARVWWPNGLGAADLYRLGLAFVPDSAAPARAETTFGIRTIAMAPLPGGPRPDRYNWTFVVNGRPTFVKGANWCTMDSSMDFRRERYDRFLSLARLQHIQILRAWGSGMPETDAFYDLCDRKGIMVLQEWPTAWDSHLVQPYPALEETIRLNTLRLRNHPSLVMYGGGNESGNPTGRAIDMMGRHAVELDGTRPFHRGEPCGGSMHNYDCYWGRQPLDRNLTMTAAFFGEFGLACMPPEESVLRYLPREEQSLWPPPADGSLAHHTPIFGTADDVSRLLQYAGYFTACRNLREFVVGSQLSQVVGLRHTLERARTRWPECTGAIYYKLNDNYPAASWSTVDWYGAPKLGQWFIQQAFAPLHACVLLDTVNLAGKPASLPVYLLDDAGALAGSAWQVDVRAYDGALRPVARRRWTGKGGVGRARRLGDLALTVEQASSAPLFLVTETRRGGALVDRAFCFGNYEATKGSLFGLPRTRVTMRGGRGRVTLRNEGGVPAVAVSVMRPGHADTFTADTGCLWLQPGESRTIGVSETRGLALEGWNVAGGLTLP